MNKVFKSVLREEFCSFMKFIELSVTDSSYYRRILLYLDSFLCEECLAEKKIEASQIKRWLDSYNFQLTTKKNWMSHIKKFTCYLASLGIPSSLPELPRKNTEFMPYVFSKDEIASIFETTDDFLITNPGSWAAAEFPLLLRILYGCGLRLGEAVLLTWDDIDLSNGVVTVKITKNRKQRIVPMCEELTRILKLYRASSCFTNNANDFLFHNHHNKAAYRYIFNKILHELGIRNTRTVKYGSRGPCLHSLRHTFTLHSLLKAESEGRGFMETVPFLSTYLGHEGLMETDKYLKARYELYNESHKTIEDYTRDIFPKEVCDVN